MGFSVYLYKGQGAAPMALPLGATATTAASGGNREKLLGQRPAGCKQQRSRRWEPQPGLGAKRLRGQARLPRATPPSDKQTLRQSDTIAAQLLRHEHPSPLSLAPLASSPKGGAIGRPVRPTRDEQSLILSETVVPCCRGQQLRDNIPCQAAVDLCSRALLFTIKTNFARPAWACPTRQCLSLWERCLRSRRRGQARLPRAAAQR